MKAYINSRDWADEGDVFFFSVESEENLKALRELIDIYWDLGMLDDGTEMYWGTNEWFDFNADDYREFIDDAVDITDEELAVFDKFGVSGFDIYDRISYDLKDRLLDYNYTEQRYIIPEHLNQEDLDRIRPAFVKLFSQETWNKVQEAFNESREPF